MALAATSTRFPPLCVSSWGKPPLHGLPGRPACWHALLSRACKSRVVAVDRPSFLCSAAQKPQLLPLRPSFRWCNLCGVHPIAACSIHHTPSSCIKKGIARCETCWGTGTVSTKPGQAGVPFYVGEARCGNCWGLGIQPCVLCAGYESKMQPPDPVNGPGEGFGDPLPFGYFHVGPRPKQRTLKDIGGGWFETH